MLQRAILQQLKQIGGRIPDLIWSFTTYNFRPLITRFQLMATTYL